MRRCPLSDSAAHHNRGDFVILYLEQPNIPMLTVRDRFTSPSRRNRHDKEFSLLMITMYVSWDNYRWHALKSSMLLMMIHNHYRATKRRTAAARRLLRRMVRPSELRRCRWKSILVISSTAGSSKISIWSADCSVTSLLLFKASR